MGAAPDLKLSEGDLKAFWGPRLEKIGRSLSIDMTLGEQQTFDTLLKLWQRRVARTPTSVCVETLGHQLSFADVDRASDAVAAFLMADTKLKAGDSVGVLMPNISQYVIAILGIMKAGLVVSNINPLYTEREVKHQLTDAKIKVVFCLSNVALALSRVAGEVGVHRVIETDLFDLESAPKRYLKNFIVRYLKKMVPPHRYEKTVERCAMLSVLEEGQALLLQDTSIQRLKQVRDKTATEHVAFYQYTGGTTGGSKGAMLTHYGLSSNVVSAYQSGLQSLQTRDQQGLVDGAHGWMALPLPLYHIYSLHCFFLFGVAKGLGVALIPNPRDWDGFMKVLKSRTFDVMPGIQTLFVALMNRPDFAEAHLERTFVLSAGMGLSPEVYRHWESLVGKTLIEGFGLTEASPVLTFNPYKETVAGSAGFPISGTLLKLRDPQTGHDLPLGDKSLAGEVLVKGPQVMKGYLSREAETRAMITEDGWLRTGDLGQLDERGYLYIVGRIKEMMIVSGFNVYPDELETVALSNSHILEAAAVSVPDAQTGERIVIYCVPIFEGQKSHEEQLKDIKEGLQKTFANSLTGYKRPREIRFCASLPKSPVGKILRRFVKERAEKQAREGESSQPTLEPGF